MRRGTIGWIASKEEEEGEQKEKDSQAICGKWVDGE
jgi:hypothetical protein